MNHKARTPAQNTAKAHSMMKTAGYAKGGAVKNVNIVIKTGGDKPTAPPMMAPPPPPPPMPPKPPMAGPGGPPPPGMMPPGAGPMAKGGMVKVRSHYRSRGGKCE